MYSSKHFLAPLPRTHFTDCGFQSHGQSSVLLWLGGGLRWISLVFAGLRDAVALFHHQKSQDCLHNLPADGASAPLGPHHFESEWCCPANTG